MLLALCSFTTIAQEDHQGPKELIEDTTNRVLQILEKHKSRQNVEVSKPMAREMLQALEPAVNFGAIARGIMGKHRKAATEEQKKRFTRVLKNTLAQLYIESLDEFSIRNVEVLDLPPDFNAQTATKASVRMRATTADGATYVLNYSMRRNEDGSWEVRNIIADGVNLGLTYRSQFDDLMSRYQDIDKVIEVWPEEISPGENG